MFLFGTVGPQELLLVLLIVVIIFGAKKLPELGKSLGDGIRNFKKSMNDANKDDSSSDKNNPPDKPKG